MLTAILLYQKSSGLLLWRYPCEDDTTNTQPLLWASFFSAAQSFITAVIKKKNAGGFNNLNMGDKSIQITDLNKVDLAFVTIAEITDNSSILMLHAKIVNYFKKNKALTSGLNEPHKNHDKIQMISQNIITLLKEIPDFAKLDFTGCDFSIPVNRKNP